MEKSHSSHSVEKAPKRDIWTQKFWELANRVLLLPDAEKHLQSPQKEKLAEKLWEYFDAKWELRKAIQEEVQNPNSVFLDLQKTNEWKEQKREEFSGLLQDDSTFDRVVDRLCEALPQFVENKKEYEQNPRLFVDNLIRQRLRESEFDPDIFDQLENRELISIDFCQPPNMIITIDGQHDVQLIYMGKIKDNILHGWVSRFGIWIEKNTGGKNGTIFHEKFHTESNFQETNKFGQPQSLRWYSSIPNDEMKFDLPKIIENYTNGGLMMEEILASFVESEKFNQWQLKDYLVDYIESEDYTSFEDIPEHESVLENLDRTRKLILQSLAGFLPIVMQRTGLSELEARQYITSGLSVYYDGSATTDLELIPKRVINTRSIPGMLRIMSVEQINKTTNENKKNRWESLRQLARMYR
jgi:hypothetical protein